MREDGSVASRIEDYALIGDTHTGAMVGRDGSIDWWCVPRFDAGACFAALRGDADNGRWLIAPTGKPRGTRRRYRDDTLILETEWDTETGTVRVIDHMPIRDTCNRLVRIVEGVAGTVSMELELAIRFDYGHVVPWVRRLEDGTLWAIAGPDSLTLRTPVRLEGVGMTTRASFDVREGERVPFTLAWQASHEDVLPAVSAEEDLAATDRWWRDWSSVSND